MNDKLDEILNDCLPEKKEVNIKHEPTCGSCVRAKAFNQAIDQITTTIKEIK